MMDTTNRPSSHTVTRRWQFVLLPVIALIVFALLALSVQPAYADEGGNPPDGAPSSDVTVTDDVSTETGDSDSDDSEDVNLGADSQVPTDECQSSEESIGENDDTVSSDETVSDDVETQSEPVDPPVCPPTSEGGDSDSEPPTLADEVQPSEDNSPSDDEASPSDETVPSDSEAVSDSVDSSTGVVEEQDSVSETSPTAEEGQPPEDSDVADDDSLPTDDTASVESDADSEIADSPADDSSPNEENSGYEPVGNPDETQPSDDPSDVDDDAALSGETAVEDSDIESGESNANSPSDTEDLAVKAPDPYFTREEIKYSFVTTGCDLDDPYCMEVENPIQAAIDDIKIQGLPDNNTIYVEAGTYDDPILIEGFIDDSLHTPLTLQGDSAGSSILSGDVAIRDSSCPIRLDTFVFEGVITLENVIDVVLIGTPAEESIQINLEGDAPIEVTVDGVDGDDTVVVQLSGIPEVKTVYVHDSGSSNSDSVTVYGTGIDDTFTFTESSISLGMETVDTLGIETRSLDASDGIDTLLGPDADTIWNLSGLNEGQILDLSFDHVENLKGAADNEDTFIFTDSGSLDGAIEGGAGGFDTLVLKGGNYKTVTFLAEGPNSGSVDLDGKQIHYGGLEPLVMKEGTAENIILYATAFDDDAVLRDDNRAGEGNVSGMMFFESEYGTFERIDFTTPTQTLTVNLGIGEDSIFIESLDSTFDANLIIKDPEDINITSDISVPRDLRLYAGAANPITDLLSLPGSDVGGGITIADGVTLMAGGDITITVNAGVDLNLTELIPFFREVDSRAFIHIGAATLQAENIYLTTSASTLKYSGFQIFEDELLNYLAGQDLAEFNDPEATLIFEDGPDQDATITIGAGTSTSNFVGAGFTVGQTIKIIGTDMNDGDDYVIANVTASRITLGEEDALQPEATVGPGEPVIIKQAFTDILPEDLPLQPIARDGTPIVGLGSFTSGQLTDTVLRKVISQSKILDFVNVPFEVVLGETESTITVGSGAMLHADNIVNIDAVSTSDLGMKTPSAVLGAAYVNSNSAANAVVESGATIEAGGQFWMNANAQNKMSVELLTERGLVFEQAGKYLKVPGLSIHFAYGQARSDSLAVIEEDAVLYAGDVTVQASNSNNFLVSAGSTLKPGSIAAAAGVAISDTESVSEARIDGVVEASGDVLVSARSRNIRNQSKAVAAVKENPVTNKLTNAATDKLASTELVPQSLRDRLAGSSQPQTLDVAAAVVFVDSLNRADGLIGALASVSTPNHLSILARAEDNFKAIATGSSKAGAKVVIGGAVSIANYTNTANASIAGGATVNVGKLLDISAEAIIPNQILVDDDLRAILDFDFEFPSLGDISDPVAFYEDLDSDFIRLDQSLNVLNRLNPYLSTNLGVPDKIATTFVAASAASQGDAGKFSLSGSVNLLEVTNTANAWIGEGAQVNTDEAYSTLEEHVAVDADASIETINIAGIPSFLTLIKGTSKSAGSAVGGTFNGIIYVNHSKAYIDDGATVMAGGNISVMADTTNFAVNVSESGAMASDYAISGVVTYNSFDSETLAYIEDRAIVNASNDVIIKAHTETLGVIVAGGLIKGGEAGIGATVVINHLNGTTKAFIGDFEPSTYPIDGQVIAGRDIIIEADTNTRLFSISIAGALAGSGSNNPVGSENSVQATMGVDTQNPSATSGNDIANNVQGSAGIGISGDVAINDVNDTTHAYISDAQTVAATRDLEVRALNHTILLAVSGAFALELSKSSGGVSIAGSFILNDVDHSVKAYTERARITARNVTIYAHTQDKIISVSAGGAAAPRKGVASVAGSANINLINSDAQAFFGEGTELKASGDVEADSDEDLSLISVAGGFSIAGRAGVGAAVDVSVINTTVKSYVENGTTVDADGDIRITASSEEVIISIAASLAIATKGLGIAGSGSSQNLDITVEAYVDGTLSTDKNLLIDASDNANLTIVGGAAAFGKQASIGLSLANSNITRNVQAYIATDATVLAKGTGDPISDPSGTLSGNGILIDATASDDLKLIAAGAALSKDVAVEASVVVNTMTSRVEAFIGQGATVNGDLTGASTNQSVHLRAVHTTDVISIAGSLAGSNKVGIGAAIDVEVIHKTVLAYIEPAAPQETGTLIQAKNNVIVEASTDDEILSISAGAAFGGNIEIAGSVVVLTLTNITQAYIGDKATVFVDNNVKVSADSDAEIISVAGNLGYGGSAGIGVSNSTVIKNDTTEAWIGAASIRAKGLRDAIAVFTGGRSGDTWLTQDIWGISITAVSFEDLLTIAVAGQASGEAAIAGSAVVNVLDEATSAQIKDGARVNEDNADAGSEQRVNVLASDETIILSIAGGLSGAGGIGFGAGADIGVINKMTQASIGVRTLINANEDIVIVAQSQEDITSISASLGAAGTAGIAGSAGIYVIDNTTLAFISGADLTQDGAVVAAEGNVMVAASDETEMDIIAGNVAAAGSVGVGASAGVVVLDKRTEALIGQNANVKARGLRGVMTVVKGLKPGTAPDAGSSAIPTKGSDGSIVDQARSSGLEVTAPGGYGSTDLSPESDTDAIDNPSLTLQRTTTTESDDMSGLSVTAMSWDDVEIYSVSFGAAGGVAVNVSGSVYVVSNTTKAYIDKYAHINQNNSQSDSMQDVLVAAGSDSHHMNIVAAASISGSASVTPGAGVTVIENVTQAYIDDGVHVNAKNDISVIAKAKEDVISIVASIAGSAGFGGGGSVSVIIMDNFTESRLGQDKDATGLADGTIANAGGDILISALDDTETFVIAGSLGVGIGAGGIGAGVGVQVIEKQTNAYIGRSAQVDAGGNGAGLVNILNGKITPSAQTFSVEASFHGVAVQAVSSEDIFQVAAAGGVGMFFGLGGGVSIEIIDSDTLAFIGDNSRVNQNSVGSAAPELSVNISAANDARVFAFAGGLGGGIAGIAGGVDVGIIRNDTTAAIGDGTYVRARSDVDVNALSYKSVESIALSAAGGIAAFAGSVSVWTVGSEFDSGDALVPQEHDDGSTAGANNDDFGDTTANADSQTGSFLSILNTYDSSSQVGEKTSAAASKVSDQTPPISGESGKYDVTVAATVDPEKSGTTAYIADNANVSAGDDVNLRAKERIDFDVIVGSASVGVVGIGGSVAIVNIQSDTDAYIAGDGDSDGNDIGAVVSAGMDTFTGIPGSGDDILVEASLVEDVNGLAFAGQAGLVSLGAQVIIIKDSSRQAAHIGSKVNIPQAGGSVKVWARANRGVAGTAIGGGFGLVTAGASIADVTIAGSTKAYFENNVRVGRDVGKLVNNIDIRAEAIETATARTIAVAAGILSGAGSDADATIDTDIAAYMNTGASVWAHEDLTVSATAMPKAHAEADGIALSIAGSVGVSLAEATLSQNVEAYIGSDSFVNAGNLEITAEQILQDGSTFAAKSDATGSGGGLLFGVSATESSADNTSSVRSYIGTGSIVGVPGLTWVKAHTESGQQAYVSGISGGIVAVGSNKARATSNTTTSAAVQQGVAFTSGSIKVTAQGEDDNYADAVSGSGGVVSVGPEAADAGTTTNSTTTASIGNGVIGSDMQSLQIIAEHTSKFNARADSVNASLVGVSGAHAQNSANATVNANIGSGVNIEARSIIVTATNRVRKPRLDVYNVRSGSGGVFDAAAAKSATTLNNNTHITVFEGATLNVIGDPKNPGVFKLEAFNDVELYDRVKLDSGGAIAIAKAESLLDNPENNAKIELKSGVTVDSVGDIILTIRTRSDIQSNANAKTYGAAGAAQGRSRSSTTVKNLILIGDNNSMRTEGDLNLMAGRDPAGNFNDFVILANTDLYNKTALPVETNPDADAILDQIDKIEIGAWTELRSVGHARLFAEKGNRNVRGYGVGKDLYREVLAAIGSFFSNLFGGGDVSLEIKGGSTTDIATTGLLINGKVEVGIENERILIIKTDGTVDTTLSSEDLTVSYRDEDLTNTIQQRIDELTQIINDLRSNLDADEENSGNPTGGQAQIEALQSEIQSKLAEQEVLQGMIDENESQITAKNNTIASNNSNIASWQDQIDTLEDEIAALDPDDPDDADLIAQKQAQIAALQANISQAQQQNNVLQGEIAQLEDENTSYQGQIDQLDDEIRDLSDQIDSIVVVPDDMNPDDINDLIAAYEAERSWLEYRRDSLGGATGTTVGSLTVDQEITAKSSNIYLTGDTLHGTGSLVAPGDTLIEIENNSPYFLHTNRMTIPDEAGGKIYFNHALVTSVAEINQRNRDRSGATFSEFVTDLNSPEPVITVINMYLPIGDELPPDIYIDADIRNLHGLVRIKSLRGSVQIQDGVDIVADTIEIAAGRDIMVGYKEGIRNVGGDIKEHWASWTYFAQNIWGMDFSTGPFTPMELLGIVEPFRDPAYLAGNNVFISAQYLNINGIVQSGFPTRSVAIDPSVADEAAEYQGDYDSGTVTERYKRDLSINAGIEDDLSKIAVFYDAEAQCFELEPVTIMGGYMELFGHIINTSVGELRVMDGYGTIDVDNQTSYPVRITTLNSGSGIEGTIKITDTSKRTSINTPLVTVYKRLGDTIHTYNNYNGGGEVDFDTPVTSTFGRETTYSPVAHQYYTWTILEIESWRETQRKVRRWYLFIPKESTYYTGYTKYPPILYTISDNVIRVVSDHDEAYWYDKTSFLYSTGWQYIAGSYDWKTYVVYSEEWWDYERYSWEISLHNHNIAAFHDINILFLGQDTGTITVDSTGDLWMDGAIKNTLGDTSLTTSGAVVQTSDSALLTGQYVDLTASSGIGSYAMPIQLDLVNGGHLNARTTSGDIYINEIQGDLLFDEITTSNGDISLSADMNIISLDSGSLIRGNQVSLTAHSGGIGASDQFVRLDSANATSGGLVAHAAADIFITETADDLYLIEAISLGGNVNIQASGGSILDNNPMETVDERAKAALLELWDQMLLLDEGARQSAENTVMAYERMKKREYDSYWNYRNRQGDPSQYDPDFMITLSESEKEQYRTQLGWNDDQITAFEGEMTAEYHNLHLSFGGEGDTYNPNWTYHIPRPEETTDPLALEEWNTLTEGYAWIQSQLENSLGIGILKEVSDTEIRIEDPNAAGHDVTLAALGPIGMDLPEITINIENRTWSALTEEEKLALLTAESSDLTVVSDWEARIIQREDVDIASTGVLTIPYAGGNVYLGSEEDIYINQIIAGGNVRIKGQQGIYNGAAIGLTNILGRSTILEAGYQSVGTSVKPLLLNLGANATLIVRAGDSIFIDELASDLNIDTIFAVNDVVLRTPASILDANNDYTLNIRSNALTLHAGASVGEGSNLSNFLDIRLNPTGQLVTNAGDGVYILSTSSLNVEDVESTAGDVWLVILGDANINTINALVGTVIVEADSAINDTNEDSVSNINAVSIDLTAFGGEIGTPVNPFEIDSSYTLTGTVRARAQDRVYLVEVAGTLWVDNILSETGDVTLVSEGSILDANADANGNVQGVNINLISQSGSIGTIDNDLDVDSSNPIQGLLTAWAEGSIYLVELHGGLRVTVLGQVWSNSGDIRLTIPDTPLPGESLILSGIGSIHAASGTILLLVGDDIETAETGEIVAGSTVTIRGDYGDADPELGSTINLQGTIYGTSTLITTEGDNDIIVITSVTEGTTTTILMRDGDDRIAVGSMATPDTNTDGTVNNIQARLIIWGSTGMDLLEVDDSGDEEDNVGFLTENRLTGLGMGSQDQTVVNPDLGIEYHELELLDVKLGSGDDEFTLINTHTGTTFLNLGSGNDTLNFDAVTGPTLADGGPCCDILNGPADVNLWLITGENSGRVDGLDFVNFENFTSRSGSGGDDTFVFSDGASVRGFIDADGGNDTLDYSAYTTDVHVDLALGLATGVNRGWAIDIHNFEHASIRGFENVFGGSGNDLLLGDEEDNFLKGNAGDDQLVGRGGNDILDSGTGSDQLDGGAGDDTFTLLPGGTDVVSDSSGIETLDFSNALYGIDLNLTWDNGQTQWIDETDSQLELYGIFENVIGTEFDDIILGNQVDNRIEGLGGNDILNGDDGDDILLGSEGDDFLEGAQGNDRLAGGPGNDFLQGGCGKDLIFFPDALIGVQVSIAVGGNGIATDGLGGIDTLSTSINGAIGTDFNDFMVGDDSPNEFYGMDGNDFIDGREGSDLIFGGDGDDILRGGIGHDTIEGGTGNDYIDAGQNNDLVRWNQGDGSDIVEMGEGWGDTVQVNTAEDDDTISLTSPIKDEINVFISTPVVASLTFHKGDIFEINSNGGDDLVVIGDLDCTDMNELIVDLGEGDDRLDGEQATRGITAYGGGGNDTFVGGSGYDAFDGGEGFDWVDYSTAPNRVDLDISYRAYDDGHESYDELESIENAIGTQYKDKIWGTHGPNIIYALGGDDWVGARGGDDLVDGGDGDDRVEGHGGDDLLHGGEGDDRLDGGVDDDTLYGEIGNDVLLGGDGSDSLDGGDGDDVLEGGDGDDILLGGPGDDNLDGDCVHEDYEGGDDFLSGGEGNDRLNGDRGDDIVLGDAGNDQLEGGDGKDILLGGTGNDDISGGKGIDNLEGGVGDDRLDGGHDDDCLWGNEGNDELIGYHGNDWLLGGEGDDVLDGGDGNDHLLGGPGDDLLKGGPGKDLLQFPDPQTGVQVTITAGGNGYATDGLGGTDTLQSSIDGALGTDYDDILIGDDRRNEFHGEGGDDIIEGNGGDDLIFGGEGEDTILGGEGNDTITGGPGVDLIDAGSNDDLVIWNHWNHGDGSDVVDFDDGWDTAQIHTAEGDDSISLSSSTKDEVNLRITGLAAASLTFHMGDIFEINTDGGDDTVIVSNLDDTDVNEVIVNLGDGDDFLDGDGATRDIEAYGRGGEDTFIGGSGHDSFDGGEGTDTVDYSTAPNRVKVDMDYRAYEDGRGSYDDLTSIENLIGTQQNDKIYGTDEPNVILVLDGNDQVWAYGGDDWIEGANGDDHLYGSGGNDTLLGGEGEDFLDGGSGDDRLEGGSGVDELEGGSGDDILLGGEGNDDLDGDCHYDDYEGGDDQLFGGEGDDRLNGDQGDDILYGEVGEDELIGGEGDDILFGGEDNDSLHGGDDDDRLAGGPGNDLLKGGNGEDILFFPGAQTGVQVTINNYGRGTATDGLGGTDTLRYDINGAIGTEFDDVLIGDDGRTEFHGMGGEDFIDGRGGNDLLYGGEGDDTLLGGEGRDVIEGGPGNDEIDGGLNDDRVVWNQGDGNDTVHMVNGWDKAQINTGEDDDTISVVSPMFEEVKLLITGLTPTVLTFHKVDIFEINTDGGNDHVIVDDLDYTDVNEVIVDLGDGDDRIEGEQATRTIKAYGGPGDDVFIGGSDQDSFDGGDGVDLVDYSAAPHRVRVNMKYEAYEDGHGSYDDLESIENLIGSQHNDWIWGTSGPNIIHTLGGDDLVWAKSGDDLVEGGDGDDHLHGEGGNDILHGGYGDDKLDGGEGDDILLGGAGNDELDGDCVHDDYEGGDDQLFGGEGDDMLNGDRGNDVLYGEAGSDELDGGEGDDTLFGGEGEDVLYGGYGDDLLSGGAGDDLIQGGRGKDLVFFHDAQTGVVVHIADGGNGIATDGLGGTDTLRSSINGAIGTEFDDILIGDDSRTEFYGLGGDDFIDGRGGDDLLCGGEGNDTILAGEGSDSVDGGSGNDEIRGEGGDDTLNGGVGEDNIDGGSGNDWINGGQGDDTIQGGDGDDLVVWFAADGKDVVDGGGGSGDVIEITTTDGDDIVDVEVPDGDTTRISGVSGLPFLIDVINTEEITIYTSDGDDTLTIYGLDFPGVRTLFADLGPGDDLLIGARPDPPPGVEPETDIIVDGGDGEDSFMGGSEKDC